MLNEDLLTPRSTTVRAALKQMDAAGLKILLVVERGRRLRGIVTDGDLRRHILRTGGLGGTLAACINTHPVTVPQGDHRDGARRLMLQRKIEAVPVVDSKGRVVDLCVWSDLFGKEQAAPRRLACPVVIMAGGKGERMAPFTSILPKPLVPLGEKPVLQVIMDRFHAQGAGQFHLVVNYKAEMIKSYFDNVDLPYRVRYVREREYQGTGGGLRLLPRSLGSPFILTNCDIIVDADYADIVAHHKANGNDLTIVAALKHYVVPYGVIRFRGKGVLHDIVEKPETDVTISTGLYVVNTSLLRLMPRRGEYHMTHLVADAKKRRRKIGVYPVTEKSYTDIGQWEEYRKAVTNLSVA